MYIDKITTYLYTPIVLFPGGRMGGATRRAARHPLAALRLAQPAQLGGETAAEVMHPSRSLALLAYTCV